MTRLSTLPMTALPSTREQAHRVLTLLGVPAPARLMVDVHGALFDGDLTIGSLEGLLRDEERTLTDGERALAAVGVGSVAGVGSAYHICRGLDAHHLTPTRGLIALSSWPSISRMVTALSARVDALTAIVRVAEFVAVRPGASRAVALLLRRLAGDVPGGPEAYDMSNPRSLADAARAALAAAGSTDAAQDLAVRQEGADRAGQLDERHQLFGLVAVPRQPTRDGGRA